MKYQSLVISLIATSLCVASCTKSPFVPTHEPNPWVDDYTPIAKMENWQQWGTYNVHDPSILKIDSMYYAYSTDAIFFAQRPDSADFAVETGYVQVRRSPDLVNWEFVGWAFPEMPAEAAQWVKDNNDGRGPGNIWAPYIIKYGDKYRLYYCASAFGKKTSYIGLAESSSPEGPWELKGCAVKTNNDTPMNAIDPTVIATDDGRWIMHYGSYFGGLYTVELDPATGLPLTEGDLGTVVARRANYRVDNLEAPEILHNKELDKYYLFGSYEPLMTTYNVRVCRSDKPEGPFIDFHGLNMADTTNNFPILTAPYQFENHPGWAGTGHCSAFTDGEGRYFMAHQSRLAPHNQLMVMHVRELFFTPDGWPVASPERYAGTAPRKFSTQDLAGTWEIVRVHEPTADRGLEAGQVLWGEGNLFDGECNKSITVAVNNDGTIGDGPDSWTFDENGQLLKLSVGDETIENLMVHAGHDWELEQNTILFTGLDSNGRSVWGKRVK